MVNIAKTSGISYESSPRDPSLDADEDKDKESRREEPIQKDATITKGIIDIEEELGADKKGAAFSTASVSPADVFLTAGVPTVSKSFPTVSEIFTTASLDKSNEVIAKHLSEYEQAEADLFVGEKIKIISELVKYQDHSAEILKYQAQQSKLSSKKEQRKFYMSVLKSHVGWKTENFRGMTLEQIKEKFIPGSKGVSEEELKGMIQLVPLEEVYIKALQVKHPIIDREIHSEGKREYWKIIRLGVKETFRIKQSTRDKEKALWVELKRLFEPDSKDQLWTYHQAFMHDPLDWKLYDTCGVHHVSTKKNQEIFMLVEKDYSLREGLATVMISNKLQVEQYSQMDSDLLLKIYNIANSPR
nr:hypothetical protein [Tanacetum cinerariifolium]